MSVRGRAQVGLGTDIAGGYSTSMLDSIRQAVVASRVASFQNANTEPLSYAEAFHLATAGGAEVLGLGHITGDFSPNKQVRESF